MSPTLSRRDFVRLSLAGVPAATFLARTGNLLAADASMTALRSPTTWGINTNIDVWNLYAKSAPEAIAGVGPLLLDLPCSIVREGLQGQDGGNNLDPINWDRWFNPWVDWLDAHGMQMCLQLFSVSVDNPGNTFDETWEKRIVHKARTAAEYVNADPKRRRVVRWFLLINEPDLRVGLHGGLFTPEHVVRVHELAYQAIKSVNPSFLVEGLTMGDGAGIGAAFPLRGFNLNTPDNRATPKPGEAIVGLTSKQVLDLGITRYCDIVGFHSYLEITEENPNGARALVENMCSANQKFGYPIRPIVNTETGPHDNQLNRDGAAKGHGRKALDLPDKARYAAIAHWQHLNRVQQARWGVARSVYYLLSGSPGAPWMQIADYPMRSFSVPAHLPPFIYDGPPYAKRPSFATAAAALASKPLRTLNGGFELPEDKFSNWLVHFRPHDFHSDDLVYGEWKESHFLHDGDTQGIRAPGSNGSGYLRLDAGLAKLVRRVVEGLEAGREYRVSVWVKQPATAKATLAVYGFDQTAPGSATVASTAKAGEWIKLTTAFTPKKSMVGVDCWGVISLEHDGLCTSWWDDVEVVPIS